MTKEEKNKINNLRISGMGYKKIAYLMNVAEGTVKSHCKRNNIFPVENKEGIKLCKNCGVDVGQKSGRKEKKFCSNKCRNDWWSKNQELLNKRAVYIFTCVNCKKEFAAYGNANRKYCSNNCFVEHKYGRKSE